MRTVHYVKQWRSVTLNGLSTSVLRLVQTLIVLMEWLLPLLEDVRLNANQRDIMAMFRDHLRELETEMQRQICEMREHILGRYHRSLQG